MDIYMSMWGCIFLGYKLILIYNGLVYYKKKRIEIKMEIKLGGEIYSRFYRLGAIFHSTFLCLTAYWTWVFDYQFNSFRYTFLYRISYWNILVNENFRLQNGTLTCMKLISHHHLIRHWYLIRVADDCPQIRCLNILVDLIPIIAFTYFNPLKQKAEKSVFKVLYF